MGAVSPLADLEDDKPLLIPQRLQSFKDQPVGFSPYRFMALWCQDGLQGSNMGEHRAYSAA